MAMRGVWLPGVTVALAWVAPAEAQTAVRGTVVASIGATPIAGALVRLSRAGVAATTDRFGRFGLATAIFPDTLLVGAIGWRPDTLLLAAEPAEPLALALERAPVVVSDLIVTAPAARPLDLAEHARWRMSLESARSLPPAVETDIYRSLALVPAVSFTSPLSARPLIRGYDAHETTTRIDGFEAFNLYHLGRIFSSFPAEAAEHVAVSAAPYTSTQGGSIAGLVDVIGRTGAADGFHAGGGTSFGSLWAYAGGGGEAARYFGAARVLHLKSLDLVPGVKVPYHFEDLYGSVALGPPGRPTGRLTLFATQDDIRSSTGEAGLDWQNILLGGRWRAHDHGPIGLELSAAASRFAERGRDVPSVNHPNANFRNRFARLTVGADLVATLERVRLATGVGVGWREVENRIERASSFGVGELPTADTRFSRPELSAYAEGTRRLGPLALELGLRADVAGPVASLQPRAHLRWSVGPNVELSAGLGRASRLYHLIGEARTEPDIEFLDLWLNPGDTIPVATADHGSLDLNLELAPFVARLSGFVSRARGIGDLRPAHDQRVEHFSFVRFGRARTRGVEAQVAYRGDERRRNSLSVSYVYAVSERDWGAGWIPWALDRRHQFRAFGQTRWGRVTWFGALDAASGMPLTPRLYVIERAVPGGGPLSPFAYQPAAIGFGAENSASTSGTFRIDVGIAYSFGGPAKSRFTLGASIINLLATAVAPIGDLGEGITAVDQAGRATPYRRLFDLPMVPTAMLRAEF